MYALSRRFYPKQLPREVDGEINVCVTLINLIVCTSKRYAFRNLRLALVVAVALLFEVKRPAVSPGGNDPRVSSSAPRLVSGRPQEGDLPHGQQRAVLWAGRHSSGVSHPRTLSRMTKRTQSLPRVVDSLSSPGCLFTTFLWGFAENVCVCVRVGGGLPCEGVRATVPVCACA